MNSQITVSDNELMFQVRDGDAAKLGILFERYHVKLYNFLVRLTNKRDVSEDLVQDVFFRMLKYGYSFRGDAPFAVWMYQLARNAAMDHFRKWNREMPMVDEAEEKAGDDPLPLESLEQGQQVEMLRAALAKLPLEKREALILSRFDNLKYEEIGEILGCPVGTVKARVHRALKDLGEEYKKLGGEK